MAESQFLTQRLLARLAGGGDQPISRVIVDEIWLAVVQGGLDSGDRLPTAREVAVELGVSPRTVEHAYRELEERGVVASRPGEGTFISLKPPPEAERERHRQFGELCREAYERAHALGFDVNDLIDSLAEFRAIERSDQGREI